MQYLADSSSRNAKQPRELILRQAGSRQNILAQNLAWMRRPSLSVVQPIVRHRLKSLVIIFKVNVESVCGFECKRDSPVAADRNTPSTSPVAFQPMQSITRQVHVRCATSAVKHI
jgi:hypothetical protein